MKRLLIANRGEIAVRIIRAAKDLGIETVAIYSPVDSSSLHVRLADKRICLGENSPKQSYLDIPKIINAAIQSGADAVHPGYGFLSERSNFAQAVEDEGLIFVGPTPESIELMGAKDQARRRVSEWKVPVVPGTDPGLSTTELQKVAEKIGYPVLLKAAYGGSGRGMRVAANSAELAERLSEAEREAAAAFGNGTVFLEKYVEQSRHIEVQIFGDGKGEVIHVGERECSLQRRHQKLVEEAPAANLDPKLRDKIREAAVNAAKSVNYRGAGTVEFIVAGGTSAESPFYFLEMNTRIQVEHPVSELISGMDLVKMQLELASGKELKLRQSDVFLRGHAIEFRVYAEKPQEDFKPTSGKILYISRALGPGVREDGWVEAGNSISAYYDSLISKIIVYGASREEAITRARRALSEYVVEGVDTTLGFHRWLLSQRDYLRANIDTKWIERTYKGELVGPAVVGPLTLPPPPHYVDEASDNSALRVS